MCEFLIWLEINLTRGPYGSTRIKTRGPHGPCGKRTNRDGNPNGTRERLKLMTKTKTQKQNFKLNKQNIKKQEENKSIH